MRPFLQSVAGSFVGLRTTVVAGLHDLLRRITPEPAERADEPGRMTVSWRALQSRLSRRRPAGS